MSDPSYIYNNKSKFVAQFAPNASSFNPSRLNSACAVSKTAIQGRINIFGTDLIDTPVHRGGRIGHGVRYVKEESMLNLPHASILSLGPPKQIK